MRDPTSRQPGPDPGRLLDRGEGGRHLPDRGRDRRRAAARGGLRGGARGRRAPGPRRPLEGQIADLLQARVRRPARVGLAAAPSGRPRRPTAGSRSAPTPTPVSCPASPPSARPRAGRRPATLMETTMKRSAEGELPLGLHAVPDQRLRRRRRDEPGRLRGLLLPAPAWPTTPTRSTPGSAPRRSASGWPSGSRGTRRCA